MKRKQTRQWFSVLLTLIVIFSSTVIPSAATNSVTNNDFGITGGIEAPQGAITASEVVSSDNVTLEEDTNLYSKTKRNDDGTYTLELFDVPVKYVDSTGKIKEKTLELKDTASAYVTRQSDISCLFPKDLSAGISLTYGDTLVKMVPDIAMNVVKTQHEDGVVSYLTSDKTLYRYSLTYMGYKEDIVVPDYTGQTEYRFTYYTNGLHMEILDGELVLTDENDTIVAGFSDVIVFTADDRNNTFGEYRCETVKANEEYRVTIVLNADYLKDEKTAYPIVIDPSFEINYDDGASAIEDATINSGTTTAPNGTSIFVGLRSTKGIARLLVKFPGYDFSQLDPSYQILSAQYIMRDLMCYSTHLPVEAHVFNSPWNESTVSWTSTLPNNYDYTVLDTQTVYYRNGNYISEGSTYSNSYAFNITNAVRGWITGMYNQEAGIMFKTTNAIETGDEYISVCFASFERSSNKPRLYVTYTIPPTGSLSHTNLTVNEGSSFQLSLNVSDATSITWSSTSTSVATVSSTGLVSGLRAGACQIQAVATNADGVSSHYFCNVYVTIPFGVYMIYSDYFGTDDRRIIDTQGGDKGYSLSGDSIQSWKVSNEELTSTRDYRAQLYKISHLGDGYYSIRPMTNSGLGMAGYNNSIAVRDGIGSQETPSMQSMYCWRIVGNSDGSYLFQNKSTSKYLALPTNSVSGTDLTSLPSSSASNVKWRILKYTGGTADLRGITNFPQNSHILPMGSTMDLSKSFIVYSHKYGENAVTSLYATNSTGGASDIAYISGKNLIGYANRAGLVTVYAYIGSVSDLVAGYNGFYFQPPESTFFYLQNIQTSNGLQYGFVQSNGSGSIPTKAAANFDPNQIWKTEVFELAVDDLTLRYYFIKNMSTGQYLTSPESTATNVAITLTEKLPYIQPPEGSGLLELPDPRQLWLIEPATSGSGGSMIRSLTMRSSGENLWLNIRSSDNTLIQHTYVNNGSYLDEFNVLYMGSDVLYQRSHPYSSTDFYETPFASTLNHLSKQYDSFTLAHRTVPLLYDKAISMAEESKIAIFCGHGAPSQFSISYTTPSPYRVGSTSKKTGILYNTDIYSGNTAIADFSGVDIVIFAGCKTAGTVSSNYNLADSAHRAGAKISIGWTDNTSSELFKWMDYFFESLHNGNTVSTAKNYADGKMEYAPSKTSTIYGNSSFKFS